MGKGVPPTVEEVVGDGLAFVWQFCDPAPARSAKGNGFTIPLLGVSTASYAAARD